MELTTCKKVCKECPFRKDSLRGWLGDLDLEQTMNAQQFESIFTCHMTRSEAPHVNLSEAMKGKQPICRGFILSASISAKMFGQNPFTGQQLRKLQEDNPLTDDDRKLIMTRWEFREHHTLD